MEELLLKNFDWESLPKVLVGSEQPQETVGSWGTFVTSGLSVVGRSMSKTVEGYRHTPHGLLVFLNTTVYYGKNAFNRSSNFLGRAYNKVTGAHPYYIRLSGVHLTQILDFVTVTEDIPDYIPANAKCAIRLDYAEQALENLKTILSQENKNTK